MSITDVIGECPENKWPLRLWVPAENKIYDLWKGYCIESHYDLSVGTSGTQTYTTISFTDPDDDRDHCYYISVRIGRLYHVDAYVLRPIGIGGKRMCLDCNGTGGLDDVSKDWTDDDFERAICKHCKGAGYVPTMLYQGDVVMGIYDDAEDRGYPTYSFTLCIVRYNEEMNRFMLENCVDHAYEMTGPFSKATDRVYVNSIFTITDGDRPVEIDDKQWAWGMQQAEEARA